MPINEGETTRREKLYELRKKNRCKVCGGWLNVFVGDDGKAFLACNDWHRTHHDGIEREASRYEKEGLDSLNIETRREIMEQEYGSKMTTALDKYMGVVSLTKPQAKEILQAVYPEAPDDEIARAVLLCASYGLNPLMKHVFLIPFNKGKSNESWATVIGIKAKRLLASRKGSYSYVDNTPRVMTDQEQKTIFGEVYADKIMVITKLKDPATGAEAPGYGAWPKAQDPYGIDKGNSQFNMAAIRSESQATDRLRPGEMPVGIEVMPEEVAEAAIEAEYTEVKEEAKEVGARAPTSHPGPKEHWCQEHNVPFIKRGKMKWWAHIIEGTDKWCSEEQVKKQAAEVVVDAISSTELESNDVGKIPASASEEYTPGQLFAWLAENMNWPNTSGARTWIVNVCKISGDKIDSDPEGCKREIAQLQNWTVKYLNNAFCSLCTLKGTRKGVI